MLSPVRQALRGVGGIILNAEGKRFCNELGRPGLKLCKAVRDVSKHKRLATLTHRLEKSVRP